MIDLSPQDFARAWIDAWNRRDVEAVLAHFAEDAVFVSPKAAAITGHGTITGKAALRAYWTAALARIGTLHFTLDRPLWDAAEQTLVVLYQAELGSTRTRACEVMRFGEEGLVVAGEGLYGAAV
jgi:ketosteroid isomerase-like protein